jgi:hypothetical protein
MHRFNQTMGLMSQAPHWASTIRHLLSSLGGGVFVSAEAIVKPFCGQPAEGRGACMAHMYTSKNSPDTDTNADDSGT